MLSAQASYLLTVQQVSVWFGINQTWILLQLMNMLFIHSVNSLTGAPQDWPMSPSYHWYKCSFISWGQRKGRAARERDDSTATLWRNTKRILLVEICWAQYVVTLCCVFAPCRACFWGIFVTWLTHRAGDDPSMHWAWGRGRSWCVSGLKHSHLDVIWPFQVT